MRECTYMANLKECREKIFSDYRERTPATFSMFERAKKVMPGGVSGNLRYFSPYPLYMKSAQGCRTVDMDDNVYIDCHSCNGPMLLGHQHPAVVAEISKARELGSMPLNPDLLIECAELIVEVIPSAERVRFVNSGTEAVMSAVRYARGYTGKDKILKFYGNYHGQDDQFLLGIDHSREPMGDGVPAEAITNTLTAPFNDIDALRETMSSREDIAAVILCPAMHAGGLWGATADFLEAAREETQKRGVVLIFDEVITGFRMGLGGAQSYHGVIPDLTVLAKAMAAGEKLGAVAGSAKVMSVTDPLAEKGTPRVFQSGTGNDGVVALAAAIGAIREYRRLEEAGEYAKLWARVDAFSDFISESFSRHSIPLQVNHLGSMMQLFIADQSQPYANQSRFGGNLLNLFYLALINEGVMLSLPTSNHIYFSFAHDEDAFREVEAAVDSVFEKYPFKEVFLTQDEVIG